MKKITFFETALLVGLFAGQAQLENYTHTRE